MRASGYLTGEARHKGRSGAANVLAPVTTYALFQDGKFPTQSIQPDKKFLALVNTTDYK